MNYFAIYRTIILYQVMLSLIISYENMFKLSSYGDNFPPLISTHAARFKFCILNTLHACHTNFTSILTHSSTPFLTLHLPIATPLSVAITHPFKSHPSKPKHTLSHAGRWCGMLIHVSTFSAIGGCRHIMCAIVWLRVVICECLRRIVIQFYDC